MRNGSFTVRREDVESELDFCALSGYIRNWSKNDVKGNRVTRRNPQYTVTEFNGGSLVLKNVQEAHVFIRGLYSMLAFDVARRKAEAEALAAYEAAKETRLAAEREREELAVQVADCPTCGQHAGERCLREPVDPTPYAAQPHKPRIDLAGVRVKLAVQAA